MNATRPLFLLGAFLFCAGLTIADPPASTPALGAASPNLLAEALPVLKARYVDFSSLRYKKGDRLDDLIARSHGEISLHPSFPDPSFHPSSILTFFIPGDIIYWRLCTFTPQNGWTNLNAELSQWMQLDPNGIILDLRSNAAPCGYDGAAHVASFFTPLGTRLFLTKDSAGEPHAYFSTSIIPNVAPKLFPKPIVVLVDNHTGGAAEALAAVLKAQGALVIGQTTKGQGVIYEDFQFSSGQVLEYVSGHGFLNDETELQGHPVIPDISLTVNERTEKDTMALIEQGLILDVIAEAVQRQRLNEAALIRGDDPEEDSELSAREKKSPIPPGVTQDQVLVTAIDSLKAINLSQRYTPAPTALR